MLASADVMAARGMAKGLETAITTAVRLLRVELDKDLDGRWQLLGVGTTGIGRLGRLALKLCCKC